MLKVVVEARRYAGLAVDTLVAIGKNGQTDNSRLSAATELLKRGYGRPAQSLDLHLSADAITKRLSDMTNTACRPRVNLDLEKFFDRFDHDRLMGQIAKRVEDKRLLKLIRAFLNAGVMENGLVSPSVEGTPQGVRFRHC